MSKTTVETPVRVMTTERVADIERRENYGEKIPLHEKLWFSNLHGIRKRGIPFAMTDVEMEEYFKCKLSVQYFAQNYCQIKREDGSIGPITLRDYQQDIIDLYSQNRFSILMASRQLGKCNSFNIKVLTKYIDKKGQEWLEEISLGLLYFRYLKMQRKLTLLEKIKYNLYNLYEKIS